MGNIFFAYIETFGTNKICLNVRAYLCVVTEHVIISEQNNALCYKSKIVANWFTEHSKSQSCTAALGCDGKGGLNLECAVNQFRIIVGCHNKCIEPNYESSSKGK